MPRLTHIPGHTGSEPAPTTTFVHKSAHTPQAVNSQQLAACTHLHSLCAHMLPMENSAILTGELPSPPEPGRLPSAVLSGPSTVSSSACNAPVCRSSSSTVVVSAGQRRQQLVTSTPPPAAAHQLSSSCRLPLLCCKHSPATAVCCSTCRCQPASTPPQNSPQCSRRRGACCCAQGCPTHVLLFHLLSPSTSL